MSRFERHIKRNLRNHSTEFDTSALWKSIKEDIPSEHPRKKRFIVLFLYGVICLGLVSVTGHGLVGQFAEGNSFVTKQQKTMAWLDNYDVLSKQLEISHIPSSPTGTEIKEMPVIQNMTIHSIPTSTLTSSFPFSGKTTASFKTHKTPSKQLETIPLEKEQIPIVKEEKAIELEAIDLSSPIAAILLDESPKTITALSIINEELEEEDEEEKKEKRKKNNDQAVAVLLGFHTTYGNANSSIIAKSDDHNDYAFNRKSTENTKNFVETGIDIKLVHKKGFTLRTGISHSRITESIGSSNTNNNPIVISSYPSSAPTNNNGSSPAQFNIGTAEVSNSSGTNIPSTTGNGRTFLSNERTLRFTDIPLVIGYQANIGKKLSMGFEVGPYFNLNSSSYGGILLENGRQIPLANGAINPFKRNIIFSSFTGLSASYQISNNFSLNLTGQYRFTPFSVTKSEYSLKQRYSSMGLSLGLLYRIK